MALVGPRSARRGYLVEPMHVVVASHQPLPAKGYGGPQRVVVALVHGLAALGHRVTFWRLPGPASRRQESWGSPHGNSATLRGSGPTFRATPTFSTPTFRPKTASPLFRSYRPSTAT